MSMKPIKPFDRLLPDISHSYKRRFPFKLGTTSFIYPAGYSENARRLAPFFDEIELILFESRRLPDSDEIQRLRTVALRNDLDYNVHMPLDVFPASSDAAERSRSMDALLRVFELTAPLKPSSWTLHLNLDGADRSPDSLKRWRGRAVESIRRLTEGGLPADRLAVENLDYPSQWVEAIREAAGVRICMDCGHLLMAGCDPAAFYRRNREHIVLIHLHGVGGGRDHRSLDRLPDLEIDRMTGILKDFTGSVSLEVFGFEELKSSLAVMDTMAF